ncbi:BRCA1-associated protein-like [Glandiceps talaboti]
MSVSLVVLRIEIAEEFPELPSLRFTAQSRMSGHQVNTDQHDDTEQGQNNNSSLKDGMPTLGNDGKPSHDNLQGEERKRDKGHPTLVQKCRGERQMGEITIETLKSDEVETTSESSEVDTMSKKNEDGPTQCTEDAHDRNNEAQEEDVKVANDNNKDEGKEIQYDKENAKLKKSSKLIHEETCKIVTYAEVAGTSSGKKKQSVKLSQIPVHDSMLDDGEEFITKTSRPGSGTSRISHSPVSRVPSEICFFSGNPSVEITKGILHLYKETFMTSLDEDTPRSEMIVLLGVPAGMTIHDLVQFTAPVNPNIEMLRIIRDSTPNQYMVLIKFKEQKQADEFYKTYNGQPFNSIEPELCHCVYVAGVETVKESEACLPIPGLTELPTCPVCLERMDESVDGILTILCNHSFHSGCLYKWGDTSCPVCRYSQAPEQVADNKCMICGAQDSLWICLICGHVGCGRYLSAHAYQHFEDTQHTYAMQLGNNRVWDYAGDNYVHRLVQSKGDGKIVEWDREDPSSQREEKVDSLTLEFTYLLTSQLESQRLYFEEKLTRVEEKTREEVSEVEDRSKRTMEECEKLEKRLSSLVKEKQSYDKKCSQLTTKLTKVNTELKEEKELNRCLRENQHLYQSQKQDVETKLKQIQQEKDKEIQDLQEQVRDLMFFLEAQNEISNASDETRQEIQDGQIVVGAAAAAPETRTHSRKGRKKGR